MTVPALNPTRTRRRAAKWVLVSVLSLFAAIGLLLFVVTLTPLVPWWVAQLSGPALRVPGDSLIVLGESTSLLPTGVVLDQASYWLCEHAKTTYRQGGFRRMVVSSRPAVGTSAAVIMADVLQAAGLADNAIRVEALGDTPMEQARRLAAYHSGDAGAGRMVVLTRDYKAARTRRALRRAGLNAVVAPAPDAQVRAAHRSERWRIFLELCRETGYLLRTLL
ncbi:MAG: YdcF family protein [Bryobacterales bacterium]|nr:YdcF family protein [Bryobacterales bacterium]